ncbi:MAG: TonB-dependent receptor plug domain-containing protein [Spirochaetaceae bacterium]|nr:TonB-dependent receptor plug domain-containing protein [Myxococcales bacterium]MCB9723113.1 TonB-dependent receptor plug domain-containing protein [Spirochaetaceae bacterium]
MLAIVAIAAGAPTPGHAQGGGDPWAGVEEMVVTGSGGVAALVEAPTSVAAFDDAELSKIGALNISDLAEYTPNLEINSPYAASNPQLFIRGVGLQDSNSNASSAVAVVVDNVYINSPAGQLSSLFDVESVEVLRGPQGAIYGRNASAGVVRVNTRRPVHEVKAGANATYGRFNQFEIDGFLNVPLVQDLLATRFAFKYVTRDPLGENRCFADRDNPFPTANAFLIGTKCFDGMVRARRRGGTLNSPFPRPPEETHNRKNWFARWSFLLEPSEELNFFLHFHGGQNLGMAPQFQNRGTKAAPGFLPDITVSSNNYLDFDTCHRTDANGNCIRNDRFAGAGDPFSGDYSVGGHERLTLGGVTLNSSWTTGAWTLTNVTDAEYADREVVIDFDASPYIQADAFVTDESWQFFDDAKLVWDNDTGFIVKMGAQFFYEELKADNNFWNTPRSNLAQQLEQKTIAAAGFGYVEWELTENLILEGGARANYERKNFTISSAYRLQQQDVFGDPVSGAGFDNRRALAEQVRPSGEVILRYEPTDDIKFYGRFTRGYKGQHFNGSALTSAQPINPVKPEFVNAFEVGWALSALDGILSWNGAGFYYDYENQQVYQLQDAEGVSVPVSVLVNAEDSRLIGMESDVTVAWEGIRWWNSVGFIFSEYSDFRRVIENVQVSPNGDISISQDIENFSGNQLVNAPEFTLVGYIQYDWDIIGGWGTLTPRFDYRYKSQVFFTPENDSRIGADPRWIFDARLDYKTPSGNIALGVWIRNLTDEFYPITAYDRKKGISSIVYVVSEPRTYGVSLSYLF